MLFFGDNIKTILNNVVCDPSLDYKFPISLPFGELYKPTNNDAFFYVYGSKPASLIFNSVTYSCIDTREVNPELWDENDLSTWKTEEYTYTVTKYISLLTPDEVIQKFIDVIKETSVIIKDSEFFLKYPIITTGVAKVFMDNCVAHLEGQHAGFINISNVQGGNEFTDHEEYINTLKYLLEKGTVISNNKIDQVKVKKYGSQNKEDYYPSLREYHLKVNKEDTVIRSKTDKRGYPASCGVENRDKDVLIIIKGE